VAAEEKQAEKGSAAKPREEDNRPVRCAKMAAACGRSRQRHAARENDSLRRRVVVPGVEESKSRLGPMMRQWWDEEKFCDEACQQWPK
jgi:hypothetical protein